eukprot:1405335-Pyramimonas_sp.AAC.1
MPANPNRTFHQLRVVLLRQASLGRDVDDQADLVTPQAPGQVTGDVSNRNARLPHATWTPYLVGIRREAYLPAIHVCHVEVPQGPTPGSLRGPQGARACPHSLGLFGYGLVP